MELYEKATDITAVLYSPAFSIPTNKMSTGKGKKDRAASQSCTKKKKT